MFHSYSMIWSCSPYSSYSNYFSTGKHVSKRIALHQGFVFEKVQEKQPPNCVNAVTYILLWHIEKSEV